MSDFARASARWLWFWMLWLMRRPWMRRLQRRWLLMVPEHRRARALESMVAQNRFALRYGLRTLVVCFNVLYASIALTVVYSVVVRLYLSGALTFPHEAQPTMGRNVLQSPR